MGDEVEYIKSKIDSRREHFDRLISQRQTDRLEDIRQDQKDKLKFEQSQMLIDYELEYLLLYYTSSLRKADDNITAYVSKLKENERILKKREKLK